MFNCSLVSLSFSLKNINAETPFITMPMADIIAMLYLEAAKDSQT